MTTITRLTDELARAERDLRVLDRLTDDAVRKVYGMRRKVAAEYIKSRIARLRIELRRMRREEERQ